MDAKICGVKDSNTLNFIINHKYPPKFIGFIVNYIKSKRYLNGVFSNWDLGRSTYFLSSLFIDNSIIGFYK